MDKEAKMKRSRAFTLVELLVVVAIIALLITLILPSLNKAKDKAKQVRCAANLHGIGIAMNTYATQNKNIVPNGGFFYMPSIRQCDWPVTLWADGVVQIRSSQINSSTAIPEVNGIKYPVLKGTSGQNFVSGRGIFYCPGYELPESQLSGGSSDARNPCNATYGFGYYAASILWSSTYTDVGEGKNRDGEDVGDGLNKTPREYVNIMRPYYWTQSHVVLADSHVRMFTGNPANGLGTVAHRHFKGANYLMGGMHVEWSDKYAAQSTSDTKSTNTWRHDPQGQRGYRALNK